MGSELIAVKNDLKNRFDDVEIMIQMLDHKSNEKIESQLLLKSSILLMAYNIVEGTMSNLLIELFDKICEKKISIDQLPTEFQSLVYKYHLKRIGNKENELKKLYESDKEKICEISYLELSKYLKLFSGNLDAKEIREISKKFGVIIAQGRQDSLLLTVKTTRNSLAHGEVTFKNASQNITVKELKEIIKVVHTYMNYIVDEYEKFINRL